MTAPETIRPDSRVAIVTGGARGIGEAVATRFIGDGYRVSIVDIDADAGSRLAVQLGESCRFERCDVSVGADVDTAVASVLAEWGRLDVVVNNAGRNSYHDAVSMTEGEWDDMFSVDLKAAWLVCRAALPHLIESGTGAIVNVSSIHARLTTAGMFPYAAAKAAVEGLTRSLAVDYARRGVRVNSVAPGWTRTHLVDEWLSRQPDPAAAMRAVNDAHPLGFIAEPDDVASVVAFLAGTQARAVTGAVYAVDCGLGATFSVG
ncbi:SDR family NAD(P)-dependent oxidoreductase [Herbiconiux sp. UC225_62]|uniref:SDR family NAD(P)-dependent oxidoreductase n=1 Tax=Herbiconiux sp. UC225_62 TaxID=3350168 RepID=UPI0036D3B626